MNRYYTQGIFGKSYKGFLCTNKKCNHTISRNELYKNWDLDYRDSWHVDITEKEPIYNEHFKDLIKGKTIEEITDDPYIFTSSTLNELSEIVKGIDKIFSPKDKKRTKIYRLKSKFYKT